MTKYRVPLKITFDGFAIVEASDELDAENVAVYNVRGSLGNTTDNVCDRVIDYEFDLHGETELSDNESIEEIEEDEEEEDD